MRRDPDERTGIVRYQCAAAVAQMIMYASNFANLIKAALAHLGERQTEVHLSPALHMRFLEVLCSIHRSGIAFAFLSIV